MPIEAIRVLLLVVLATPFAFALILAMSKKAGLNTIRQLAVFFAFRACCASDPPLRAALAPGVMRDPWVRISDGST